MRIPFFRGERALRTLVDESELMAAIGRAEEHTSGEIKLFIERRNPLIDVLERASEIFHELQMQKTQNRNAVLIYLAHKDREFALYGDQGIFEKYSQSDWQRLCDDTDQILSHDELQQGLEYAIAGVGQWLSTQFPAAVDCPKNELPDEIVFGL